MGKWAPAGLTLLLLIFEVAPHAQAQVAAGTNPSPKLQGAEKPATAASKSESDDVLALVEGTPITRDELLKAIGRAQIPPGKEKLVYDAALQSLIDRHVLPLFMDRHGVKVSESEIDQALAEFDKQIREQTKGKFTLETFPELKGVSKAELREQTSLRKRLAKLFDQPSIEPELRAFFDKNRDFYDRVEIVASHILLKFPPKATAEQKAAIKERILKIKKDIESGAMTFAEAANKYSEDEGNEDKVGGSLGKIYRKGRLKNEKFLAAAFALKKAVVSDPVETELGYHLIFVSDRTTAKEFFYETNKSKLYSDFLQDALGEERKRLKIEIKPMPADLFAGSGPPAAGPARQPSAATAPR